MNRSDLILALAICAVAAAPIAAQDPRRQQASQTVEVVLPTLTVSGLAGKTVTLTAFDLAKLPQQTVKITDRGTPVTFGGVLLADVLAKVDLPSGEPFHKTAASYYLLVQAKDGYRVVFAWAELDPSFMDKAVYLVTTRDGKPLADKDGSFQLVVPGEKRNARWVRQITGLAIGQAK